MPGILHVVATPLGHLDDLSPRARSTLAACALIACEDTRRTAKLLSACGISRPTLALHKFSERDRIDEVLAVLRRGEDVALVSDGGTPGLSDPGSLLAAAAHEAGIRVSPVPGPSAVAALLSVAGLPGDRFVFDGFLPARAGERRTRLRSLRGERRTIVIYEAPHRVKGALADLDAVLGARPIVLGRELTKIHETVLHGSARDVLAALGPGEPKGEIVIAIAGAGDAPVADEDDTLERVWARAVKDAEGDARAALKAAARELGLRKPEVWRRLAERRLVRD